MTLRLLLVLFILLLLSALVSGHSLIMLILGLILLISANMNYLKSWSHVLLMLLTLEVLMLANTLFLSSIVSTELVTPETLFMLFTLAVCEASMGVAVLVCYSRAFGNDLLQSSSVL